MPTTPWPEESGQLKIPFRADVENALSVLDLFAGTGGLSLGFATAGFAVTGVDLEPASIGVFDANSIGELLTADLHTSLIIRDVPVVIGGPPCRPWSAVNVQRRGSSHEDYGLVGRFFEHLHVIKPHAFLMENVPPLGGDPIYRRMVSDLKCRGYSVASEVLRYSDFGAATTRKRLFTVGFRDSLQSGAEEFFRRLRARRRPPVTVRDAIGWLRDQPRASVPDHEWSSIRTIGNYAERYRTGRYGWKRLEWDEQAPSFGSVSKTYVLHPDSDPEKPDPRVLSVREILSIMGFEREFRFPAGTGLTLRYRMAANAVSPIVAANCAHVIRELIWGEAETTYLEPGGGVPRSLHPSG
jgi:DNA (cytosine-5)-methyltransferase 1